VPSHSIYIVEDDYDSELRYWGRELPSLWSLDRDERVGYVVLPHTLVRPFVRAKVLSDLFSPLLEQAVLSDFVAEGHFVRHLRRMRVLYAKRQEVLLEQVRAQLGDRVALEASPTGMHLVAWLPDRVDDTALARRIGELGVHAQSLSFFRVEASGGPALLLGYAGVPIPAMRQALSVVRTALDEVAPP
jgi:GntR family transcriptional regulator/MocR family aminotransferase